MNDIVVKIRADGSGMGAGMNQAASHVNKFASDVKRTIAGAFSGAAFVSAIRKTIADIDQMGDVAEEFNMPVEQVQALKQMATEASDSFEKLLTILTKIQDIQIDIVKGDSPTALKNRKLMEAKGYSVDQINSMSLVQFAQAIAKSVTDKAELNQLLGPRMAGKFNNYRSSLMNVDERTAAGLKNGTIQNSEMINYMNQTISEGKEIWDSLWQNIFFTMSWIVVGLRKILGYIGELIDRLPGGGDSRKAAWSLLRYASNPWALSMDMLGDKKKNETSPSIEPLVPTSEIKRGARSIYSDSLLSVGRFLGAGDQSVGIVDTLVAETKKQTEILSKIEKNTAPRDISNPRGRFKGWDL